MHRFILVPILIAGLHASAAGGPTPGGQHPSQPSRTSQNARTESSTPPRANRRNAQPKPARPLTPISKPSNKKQANSEASPSRPGVAGSVTTTIGSLAIVVVLILLGATFLKKHGPLMGTGLPSEAVDVLGRKTINQRQSIHLVRLGSRILVIGSSLEGLTTLAEVTDPVEVDYLSGICRPSDDEGTAAQTFRALFHRNTQAHREAPISDIQTPRETNTGDSLTQPPELKAAEDLRSRFAELSRENSHG